MPKRIEGTVTVRDAEIFYRNFRGKQTEYNAKGDKNFCCKIDPDVAEVMARDGWNIKMTKPREEGDVPEPYIQVKVGNPEKGRQARITLITSRGRTPLDYEDLDHLDYVDITKIDLIFGPYNWTKGANTGVSAYLRTAFITIHEDELEQEYNVLPIDAAGHVGELPQDPFADDA